MPALTVEARLQRLEDLDAIRELKARYLAACDAKNPAVFRACFCDGPVEIDYGPLGQFESADTLVNLFTEIACHPHMLEWHHATNPQIKVLDVTRASGHWSLQYQLINTQDNTLTQLGGEYTDEYHRTDAGWKIFATRFAPRTQLVLQLGDAAVQCLASGSPSAPS